LECGRTRPLCLDCDASRPIKAQSCLRNPKKGLGKDRLATLNVRHFPMLKVHVPYRK